MLFKWVIFASLVLCVLFSFYSFFTNQIGLFNLIVVVFGSTICFLGNSIEYKALKKELFKALMKEGEELYRSRQTKNAIGIFNKALNIYPNSLEALMGKAQCYRMLMDYEKSLEICKLASSSNLNAIQPYFISGLIYLQSNNPKFALDSFLKVEKLDSSFVDVYLLIAQIYEKIGEYNNALNYYKKYLDKGGPMKEQAKERIEALSNKLKVFSLDKDNSVNFEEDEEYYINRRRHLRIPIVDIVKIRLNNSEPMKSILVDLSAGGSRFMVMSQVPLTIGDEVELKINILGRKTVFVQGDIVWAKETNILNGSGLGTEYMAGIEFGEVSQEIEKFVSWFTKNREESID